MNTRSLILSLVLTLLGVTSALAQGGPGGLEILVIGQDSLYVIDPVTTGFTSFSISDPDGDSLPDTPRSISVSTVSGGRFAFVTYEEGKIAVVDVPARSLLSTVHDVTALINAGGCHGAAISSIELGGGATSILRRFDGVLGPVDRADLHVAATLPTGEAFFVVLDQLQLLSVGGAPLIDCGVLETGASGIDVTTLDDPSGDRFARALYSVGQTVAVPEEVAVHEVSTTRTAGSPWTARELGRESLAPGRPAPGFLEPGSAPGRDLAVHPQSDGNRLLNPYLGGECDFGGNLVAADITGHGLYSYELWALDHDANTLMLIDPNDCDATSISVGDGPVALTTLGRTEFGAVFVVNRDSDTVSRVNADGTVTTIFLSTGGGSCTVCPVDTSTALVQRCDADGLTVDRGSPDPLGQITFHLDWSSLCPPGTEFIVECACRNDDPDCPCRACDCALPINPPECFCPGFILPGPVPEPVNGGNVPLVYLPPDKWIAGENPWIDLGVTEETEFDHTVDADNAAALEYQVKAKQ